MCDRQRIAFHGLLLLLVLTAMMPLADAAPDMSGMMRGGHPYGMAGMDMGGEWHDLLPPWSDSLNEVQKTKINSLHVDMKKQQSVIEAEIQLRDKELNLLLTSDRVDNKAVDSKIDQIMKLKRQLIRLRADHIVDMRRILNPEQRQSFDTQVLSRRHQHGH